MKFVVVDDDDDGGGGLSESGILKNALGLQLFSIRIIRFNI